MHRNQWVAGEHRLRFWIPACFDEKAREKQRSVLRFGLPKRSQSCLRAVRPRDPHGPRPSLLRRRKELGAFHQSQGLRHPIGFHE